jgi:predicted O-methyltransferase YrrM
LTGTTFRGWRQFVRDVVLARRVGLSPRVALFYARACRIARQVPDEFTLVAMTRADDLARLLVRARGSRRIVEIGTGSGTTSIALALDDRERLVWSYDVKPPRAERELFLRLVPNAVRERITFFQEAGTEPSSPPASVDLLFIDGSHQREDTAATFHVWEPQLVPRATVAFHDYGRNWPGVAQAIEDLGLDGEVDGLLFVWRRQTAPR